MEGNKEEAIRCLSIAQRHRTAQNLPSALKFAQKSVTLFSTPEGNALVTILIREISIGTSSSTAGSSQENGSGTSTPNGAGSGKAGESSGSGSGSRGKASGVEEHVTSATQRPGHSSSTSAGGDKGKKREFTPKQMEVVKRVKMCKHHEYYAILSLETSCSENDVKKAYKKLALALHPDKNGAPGADEAFKMVSKAFQVLSDSNLRAAFDSNPHADPSSRSAGMSRGGGGGGMHPGFSNGGAFQTEINPEDLFNMFFGGGGGGGFGGGGFGSGARVYSFGGGQSPFGAAQARRRATAQQQDTTPQSPLLALLPILILFAFALLSILPSMFGDHTPDPKFSWEKFGTLKQQRNTWRWGVNYFVDKDEWEGSKIWDSVPEERRGQVDAAMFSQKVRSFENGVEQAYSRKLQNECQYFEERRQRRISEEAGFFGLGANYDKIRELRAEKSPACEQLKVWGVGQQNRATF